MCVCVCAGTSGDDAQHEQVGAHEVEVVGRGGRLQPARGRRAARAQVHEPQRHRRARTAHVHARAAARARARTRAVPLLQRACACRVNTLSLY